MTEQNNNNNEERKEETKPVIPEGPKLKIVTETFSIPEDESIEIEEE